MSTITPHSSICPSCGNVTQVKYYGSLPEDDYGNKIYTCSECGEKWILEVIREIRQVKPKWKKVE